MGEDNKGNIVQAFPININTFAGVPTNQKGASKILHSVANGDVTFHFGNTEITMNLNAGSDVAISSDCTGVTSSKQVIIS